MVFILEQVVAKVNETTAQATANNSSCGDEWWGTPKKKNERGE
jgi:hypothetical protein